jgi:hypothetical protein
MKLNGYWPELELVDIEKFRERLSRRLAGWEDAIGSE